MTAQRFPLSLGLRTIGSIQITYSLNSKRIIFLEFEVNSKRRVNTMVQIFSENVNVLRINYMGSFTANFVTLVRF